MCESLSFSVRSSARTDNNSSSSFTNVTMATFFVLALMFVDDVASTFLGGVVLEAEILGLLTSCIIHLNGQYI